MAKEPLDEGVKKIMEIGYGRKREGYEMRGMKRGAQKIRKEIG